MPEAVQHRQQFLRQAFHDATAGVLEFLLLPAAHVDRIGERALTLLVELVALLLQGAQGAVLRHLDGAFAHWAFAHWAFAHWALTRLRRRVGVRRFVVLVAHEKMSFTFSKIVFLAPFFLPSSSS